MISSDSVENIKQQLKTKARDYYAQGKPDMADKVWLAYDALEAWERQGMPGEVPVDLAEFDLELPAEFASHSEQPMTSGDGVEVTLNVEASTDSIAEAPNEPEPDGAAHQHQATQEARPREEAAQAASQVADTVLRREQLRRQAKDAKARGNLATATDLWRQLLEIEPDDLEARRELQQHAAALSEESIRKMVNELRRKASQEVISDLDEALVLARNLLTSMELDDATQRAVQKLEEDARKKRTDLKAASGEIDTFAAAGNLKEAIARLEDFIKRGRFEYEDRDGIVSTSVKLRELNQEYASFCTQKTYEYLERAEVSLPAFPKSAMGLLDQAWNNFDKADPGARAKLEQRRTEIQELITRWETGQSLAAQATKEKNPELRLGLFLEAKSQYDGLFNINDLIDEAKRDAAGAVTNDIKNSHDTARIHLLQGDLDIAQKEALKARVRAGDVRGASPALEAELVKIDQLMVDIANAAGQKHLADEAAKAIDQYLKNHDYAAADQAIALLPEEVRNLSQVTLLEGKVARERGGDRLYQVALQRYEEAKFQAAIDLLKIPEVDAGSVTTGSAKQARLDERSEALRQRAQAMLYYLEGLSFLQESPEDAELSFELAKKFDPALADQVAGKLATVATRKAERALVQERQKNAQELMAENSWQEAYDELGKAKDIDSPLKAEVTLEWAKVRKEWRDQLLTELYDVPAESEGAKKIVDQLHDNELLDSSEDQEHVAGVELSYYRARGQRSAQGKRWPVAIAAWRAVLALEPDDVAAQESLREALREQALVEAHDLYTKSKNAEESLSLLDQRLEQPELQGDPLFLAELVRRGCQFGDFARAEHYLELLVQVTPEGSALTQTSRNLLQQTQSWSDAQNRSQKAIADGRYAAAVRALDDVIAAYPNADSRAQWQRERNGVQKSAVTALLDRAREKKRQATGLGRIEVISLYSQVMQLVEPDKNVEAEEGIAEVQGELPNLVQSIVEDGERFNPETREPDEALREVERLLDQLNDFRVVTSYMGNQRTRWERRIEEVSTKLGNQRERLRKVSRLMEQTRKALDNPTSDQIIVNAETWLRDAKRDMPKAVGITELEQQVKQARDEREQLKKAVSDLKDAARNVDDPRAFQSVLEAARRLHQIDPEDRYQLQTPQNLDVYDDYTDAHINGLEEHEQVARNRQENYRLYSEWEKRCIPLQETLAAAHSEVDDKRLRGSLEEQQEALDRTIAVGQRALQAFRDRPKPDPASYPADDILAQISDWQKAAEAAASDLTKEVEQVVQLRVRRDEWAARLTKVLSRPAVTANIAEANRCLDELRKLDPNWPDLAIQEQAVRVWKDSRSGGLLSRFRN